MTMNLYVNPSNPYNFFSMDTSLNIRSKQEGTIDYDEILKYRVSGILSRLDSQLDGIPDETSEEYTSILKLKEELLSASEKVASSKDPNILVAKDMPKVIDIIIAARVSNFIESVEHELVGEDKSNIAKVYPQPQKTISKLLTQINTRLRNVESSKVASEDFNREYNDLIRYKEFLELVSTTYDRIDTPKKRDLLDLRFLEEGKFRQRDIQRWSHLPNIDAFEEKDSIISERLSKDLSQVLARSEVKGDTFTRSTDDPYDLILRRIERFRQGNIKYIDAPYRWQIIMSRQPSAVFQGRDDSGAEILAYKYGRYNCQSMFLPPSPKNPIGKPVFNNDKDIVGVSRIEKDGSRKDYVLLFSVGGIPAKKIDPAFVANIYFSRELMDAVVAQNYSYLGDIEVKQGNSESQGSKSPYNDYRIIYNGINDDAVVSSLRLGFSTFDEAMTRRKIHRVPLRRDGDPFLEYVDIHENLTRGQLIENRNGEPYIHKQLVELPEMMDKITEYHRQIVDRVLDRRKEDRENTSRTQSQALQPRSNNHTEQGTNSSTDEPGAR